MRIQELTAYRVRIPLKKEIKHASHARSSTDSLIVRCQLDDGQIGWGEGLRAQLGPAGIRVTVVTPGFFDSAMGARFHGRRMFVLSQDQAADRVWRALEAGAPRAAFPWALALGLRLLALLPPRLGDWAVRRMRFRVSPEG